MYKDSNIWDMQFHSVFHKFFPGSLRQYLTQEEHGLHGLVDLVPEGETIPLQIQIQKEEVLVVKSTDLKATFFSNLKMGMAGLISESIS